MSSDPFKALMSREATRAFQGENATRLAWAYGECTTHGMGEHLPEDRIPFDTVFIEKPFMSWGFALADEEQLVEGRFPRAQVFVRDWDTDRLGNYTGCWLGVTVDTCSPHNPTPPVDDPGYDLEFFLTFAGIAMKPVPAERLKG